MTVSFYGSGETTGTISKDRNIVGKPLPIPPGAICETTGSCAIRNNPGEKVSLDQLEKDVVCFRGKSDEEKGHSIFGTLLTIGALAAVLVGFAGYAHKYGLVNKIPNEKVKGWLQNSNKITQPCYDLCKKTQDFVVKHYKDIVAKFKK